MKVCYSDSIPESAIVLELKERTMKVMMSLLIAATFVLAGCNTMHGMGHDVEKVGDKIQEKSAK